MAGPVSGAHLNPAVRLVRNFCIIFCHFFCLPYHHTSTLQLGCFAIFLSFTFLLLLLYGSQDLFSSTFLLLYHHYVLVFTQCKYSPFTSTALAAVGKFDWKKVKPNFSKTDICVFCVFVFKWCFFPWEQSFQFIQLGHFILAQYLGAFLGAALVFFTYKVRP